MIVNVLVLQQIVIRANRTAVGMTNCGEVSDVPGYAGRTTSPI